MSDVTAQLDDAVADVEIGLEGKTVRVTSLDRVLWPETATTKRDLLRYYVRVADRLLAWIRDRPLTLFRCPEGVAQKCWYQTSCPHPPGWLRTATLPSAPGRRYCVIDDLAGLLWAGNRGTIELHRLQSTCGAAERPTHMVFDLDPEPGAGLQECAAVALLLRGRLSTRDAAPVASGSRGLHIYVPMEEPTSYRDTKTLARCLAEDLAREHPDLATVAPQKAKRLAPVYVDWVQNDINRSLVAPFSPRATPRPAAALPLTWDEVASLARGALLETDWRR
ncbi:MAG TPA: non-homologous end-joining DNA ligase [Actinomycetota bacterium]|nr:non-homologous end-joining DNA ligase [Actinomycetota bacterium]